MVLNELNTEGVKVSFVYMPSWEMFMSMHVLAVPEHHLERMGWYQRIEKEHGNLVEKIRKMNRLTCDWTMIIDSDVWMEICLKSIPETLEYLKKMDISKWNRMICFYHSGMSISERNEIISAAECYYREVFCREEIILGTFLKRVIQEEYVKCRKSGIWSWCKSLHTRLQVTGEDIRYLKNRDYIFQKKEIHTVYATVSTFLSPHLWLYERNGYIQFIKSVVVERKDEGIPQDFLNVFRALGDETRLKIIREILNGTRTTKALAGKVEVTEAAVSKHLKILWEAGLLEKKRCGNYVEYYVCRDVIDFIPYRFYELMQ